MNMSCEKRTEKKKTRNKVRKLLIFILTGLIILTISIIGNRVEEERKERTFQVVLAEKVKETSKEIDLCKEGKWHSEEDKSSESIRIVSSLKEENPDTIGVLILPFQDRVFPILVSESGEYLRRNFEGKSSSCGSIFVDKEEFSSGSSTRILYGHNMKSGNMFGFLDEYFDSEYAENGKDISICWEGGAEKYELCGVVCVSSEDKSLVKELLFPEKEGNENLKEKMEKDGKIYRNFTENDHLIILATCEYSKKSGRLLVIFRKIWPGIQSDYFTLEAVCPLSGNYLSYL